MDIKWEEYIDIETNIEYKLPYFTLQGYESQNVFYNKNHTFIYDIIFSSIEYAVLNKIEVVPCFIMDGFIMSIEHGIFLNKLEDCRIYFEQMELYEKCTQINKLKELINKTPITCFSTK